MASLTPRMQIERLAIGDDPICIGTVRVRRISNHLYEVNGERIGTNHNRVSLERVIGMVCDDIGRRNEPPPVLIKKRRIRATHPCVDCGNPCGYRSPRCRLCGQRVRRCKEIEGRLS